MRSEAASNVIPAGGMTRDVIRPPVRRRQARRPMSAPLFRTRDPSSASEVAEVAEITRENEQVRRHISDTVLRFQDALETVDDDDEESYTRKRRPTRSRVSLMRRETIKMEAMRSRDGKRTEGRRHTLVGSGPRSEKRFGNYTEHDVIVFKRMYQEIDTDGGGVIDHEEFMNSPAFQSSELFYLAKSTFRSLDADGSGEIELRELLQVAFPLVRAPRAI
jgi:hypothetical protein